MNKIRTRDAGHTLLSWLGLMATLAVAACSSGVSGHAPGVAGLQSTDPGTFTYPLAYIKRPPSKADVNVSDLITSTTGGDLYVRAQASAGGLETNVTMSITGGMGDVRDLDVSPDGKKLVFALRLPLDATKPNTDVTQPNWHIYQYDSATGTVTQLTDDESTSGHDVGPHYLPDGRIVFSSTRQAATQSILVDENRPEYAAQTDSANPTPESIFLLHVMNADGTGIHQISFNTDHDFAPSVLNDGQIVFSRFDSTNGGQVSLYRTNPDGTGLELYYGENSHATGVNIAGTNDTVIQFLNARQMPNGKLMALVRPFLGTQLGGDLVQIDADNYVEMSQPAAPGGGAGPAQSSATTLGVTTDPNAPSLGGRFASAYPLYDGTNRLLVSWSPCLVVAGGLTSLCTSSNTGGTNVTLAPPQYTLWVYDLTAGTLSPLLAAESGLTIVEPVVLQARAPAATFIPDVTPTGAAAEIATTANGQAGLLVIRSVYDFDGIDTVPAQTAASGTPLPSIAALADPKQATADQRPARFIRIEKAVEIPGRTVRKIAATAFGPTNMGMREILAYAPIEPDGSVKLVVPANVPFTIDILDANARRISSQHTNWLQLMPGETKTCNGCHAPGNAKTPSHGRAGLTATAYPGATGPGPFPDTIASLPAASAGDTMADARAAATCPNFTTIGCSETPAIDVIYSDVWTDPQAAGRPADAPFAYQYSALSTAKPNNVLCLPWYPQCRSTIHYPLHIQPIWSFLRQTLAADGVTVQSDHTCTNCHNPLNAANTPEVPAGQLDLTASTDSTVTTVTTSYEELLFAHNEQQLTMGILGDLLVAAPGPPNSVTGAPTTVMVPVSLAPPLTAGSAIGSMTKFLGIFDASYQDPNLGQPGEVDHRGFLTPAELRLISEWLDIGAQYYNDPFVAPVAN